MQGKRLLHSTPKRLIDCFTCEAERTMIKQTIVQAGAIFTENTIIKTVEKAITKAGANIVQMAY